MKGKSLEDINRLFEDRVSIMQFGRTDPTERENGAEYAARGSPEGKEEAIVLEVKQDPNENLVEKEMLS
jgi:hypothetical protein